MKISEALKALKNDEPILVRDKTVEPHNIDEFKLETGEMIYWIKDGTDVWLAIDEASEEVILFNEIEADVDLAAESVFYAGDDYEFTFEASAQILDEDGEEQDKVDFRDYERTDGQVIRVMEFEVNGDMQAFVGWKVAEEELQEI